MANFVAIDFETADQGRDSACAIGLVKVADGRIVEKRYRLIRPPRQSFVFTYLHGISWHDVADQPKFDEVWSELAPLVEPGDLILAHNASFDRSVLAAGCDSAGLSMPRNSFACTVKVARELWDIRPTKLNDVCRHLGIELRHHQADSDAHACAQIGLAALREGFELTSIAKPVVRSKRGAKAVSSNTTTPRAKRVTVKKRQHSGSAVRNGIAQTVPERHKTDLPVAAKHDAGPTNNGAHTVSRLPTRNSMDDSKPPPESSWPGPFATVVFGSGIAALGWLTLKALF